MKYYGGIDLGGTNTKIGLLDEKGTMIFNTSIKTNSQEGVEKSVKRICDTLLAKMQEYSIDIESLNSAGVGIPGPAVNKRIVKMFANFPWPKNLDLAKEFEKCLGKPVYVENDVNVITLGEVWVGAAKGFNEVFGMAIGTGIGGAVVSNSRIIPGKIGAAGEVGHIKLYPNGKLCGCTQKGCFEAYASATGIIREANSRLMVNKNNLLYEMTKDRELEAKDIFDAAKQGDRFSLDIVEDIAEIISYGLGNILNILDPQIVVIGGGVALAGEMLFSKIREKLPKYALGPILETLEIKEAILGNDAGIYGSAYLAMIETK
ncbi:ROK family protein [Caviibacter abscessus]|uniref:ROK family protein n=1 Tax=Caviibacter abscessus TaxID=1766719 RepID=UPI000837A0A1|nr:ROK family protein [Caviibacter abscessus]